MRARVTAAAAAAALGTVLVAGCAGHRAPAAKAPAEAPVTTVSEEDLGRLAPAQMAPVQAARTALDQAKDTVARAALRLQQSRHESAQAQADRAQAEAERLRAAADLSAAREAGDGRRIATASEQADTAALLGQAAAARDDYAARLVAAREADARAAEARVRRAEWELERAKLSALRDAGIPAASKYEAAPLDRRVQQAQAAESALTAKARDLDVQAAAAHDRWRSLADRYDARTPTVPRG